MKIIDAYWEKRNLGVTTTEIHISRNDSVEDIIKVLDSVDAQYIIAKVASGVTDKMALLQNRGFTFIETSILLESRIAKMKIPPMYKRFMGNIDFVEADEELTQRVLDEVSRGEIFKTDRIALDPFFSEKIAGRRYSNWIQDELQREAVIYIAIYKGAPVSFTIVRPVSETVFNSFLGGVFKEKVNKGFGFTGLLGIAEKIAEKGGQKITTRVSSNNLPMLRLHMDFGYEIQAMDSVFIKHR